MVPLVRLIIRISLRQSLEMSKIFQLTDNRFPSTITLIDLVRYKLSWNLQTLAWSK